MNLKNKVIFITGGSRGIGRQIALRVAAEGAKVVIAAKTSEAHAKLPGTIHSVAEEIIAAGGEALAIQLDVRDADKIKEAVAKAVEVFGGIDIVVNNAGILSLAGFEETDIKTFDLMIAINFRAVFVLAKEALPHLRKSENAHILNISPPMNMDPEWFKFMYTMGKYNMSMLTLGLSQDLAKYGIAVNSLWPETLVDTSAVRVKLGGADSVLHARKPEIVADAAHWIVTQPSKSYTGHCLYDGEVVKSQLGVEDLSIYAVDPTKQLITDFFIGKPPKVIPGQSQATKPKAEAGGD